MNEQTMKEKRMAELFEKLSPALQEKVICFAEGPRLAETAKSA